MPSACLLHAVSRRVISAFLHQAGIVGSPGIAWQQHQDSQIHSAQFPAGQPVPAVHQSGQHVLSVHCIPAAYPWFVPYVMGDDSRPPMLCPIHQWHQGEQCLLPLILTRMPSIHKMSGSAAYLQLSRHNDCYINIPSAHILAPAIQALTYANDAHHHNVPGHKPMQHCTTICW